MSGKFALIIGNTEYSDPGLRRLTAPGKDTEDFARVLRSQDICAFDQVNILLNQFSPMVIEAIDEFFDQKKPDDLLVLYFSGHGVRDELGSLYLAVKNTIRSRLRSTAIRSDYIREAMDQSRSKRQLLILDCCNSGAFPQGTKAEVGGAMGMTNAFQGYGRFVLTASDATQFAWEGNTVIGETQNSLFTHFLVKGLEGDADSNGDGRISIDELYDYAYEQIFKATPKQTPTKSASKQEGEIILRQNMRLEDMKPVPLPTALLDSIESPFPEVRLGTVQQLIKLLHGKNLGLARSAREALERIAENDDSRQVSKAASQPLESSDPTERPASHLLQGDGTARRKAAEHRDQQKKKPVERLEMVETEPKPLKARAIPATKTNRESVVPEKARPAPINKVIIQEPQPAQKQWLKPATVWMVFIALALIGLAARNYLSELFASPAPTATEAPVPTEPAATQDAGSGLTSTATVENIRSFLISILEQVEVMDGPSHNFEIIGQLTESDSVIAVNCGDANCDWLEVTLPSGGTGWIRNDERISYSFSTDNLSFYIIDATATAEPAQEISPLMVQEINLPLDGGLMDSTWDGDSFWVINRMSDDEPGKAIDVDMEGNLIREWPLAGAYLFGSTYDGTNLWYVETNIGWIFSLQLQTGEILNQISTPGWGNIGDLAWDGKYMWASSGQPYRIYKVDPTSGSEVESFPGPIPPTYDGPIPDFDGENTTDLWLDGLAWDGKYLWICESSTKTIMKVNPFTGNVVEYFVINDASYPGGLDWAENYLWVSDWVGKIIAYDP